MVRDNQKIRSQQRWPKRCYGELCTVLLDPHEHVKLLPHRPGVYQFLNKDAVVIYVGKAKDLRNRVGSYFAKNLDSGKTAAMVKKIVDLRVIVVESEYEALLLENSLIKEHQPRYNIQWRDDKSYPFLRVRKERFPRVQGMRNPVDDGSEYFGPYGSVKVMKALLETVTRSYQLRTCNYDLSEENIAKGKYKVCLEYHIGNCKGPCEGLQPVEEYDENVKQIRRIVRGNTGSVIREMKELMRTHAEKLEFELAQRIKERIDRIEKFHSKSVVVNPNVADADVFSIIGDQQSSFVNYMRVIDGAVVNGITIEMKRKLEEEDKDLLQLAVAELRERYKSTSPEVLLPIELDLDFPDVQITVPQRGDKKALVELSARNAKFYMLDKQRQEQVVDPEAHQKRVMDQLQKDLRLPELPVHIECFDNSNTQGSEPVSACVVFRDAKPSKKDYRHFNIRTVEGPDDFASMEEALERRYGRMLREDQPLPQLIVIDGGKGQLSSAVSSLDKLDIRGKVAIIGIAKKLEEIYFPDDPVPLHLDKRGTSLKLIQFMRNEAHRFGITHHRKRRAKRSMKSQLEDIPGVGPATVKKLLKKFGSVKGVKEATMEMLEKEVGTTRASAIAKALEK